MKVLIVDDDAEQLAIRTLLLSKTGFEPIPASDSASAISAATAQKPECAVLDLRLPTEALGRKLIRDLKQMNAGIRLFILTGGDPLRVEGMPERSLVEEVIVKGSPFGYLLEKLRGLRESEPRRARS